MGWGDIYVDKEEIMCSIEKHDILKLTFELLDAVGSR